MADAVVSKYVLEIRFLPLPSILDKRGDITEKLLDEFFDAWTVNPTRLDVASRENKNIGAYVTYANFGLASESPNKSDLFIEKSQSLIRKLWTIIPMSRTQRFGIRAFQISPYGKTFKSLLERYEKKTLAIPNEKISSFGGNLIDIGWALNFEDPKKHRKYNINSGPMKKEQAMQFFTQTNLLPHNGIFVDVDYFTDAPSFLNQPKQSDFLKFIEESVSNAQLYQEKIHELLLADGND